MKVLNLTNLERSDIKYKISLFPDGQQDIQLIDTEPGIPYLCLNSDGGDGIIDFAIKEGVKIKSHFNSFKDLELIICTANALRRMGVKERHLYIPYLLGARSDRQFVKGGNSYLVDIIAPQLNQTVKELNGEVRNLFSSVTVIDAHSDVSSACINNLNVIDNVNVVKFALTDLIAPAVGLSQTVIVSPDAGAMKKIYHVAESINYTGDILIASKHRDIKTGKILSTDVPLKPSHSNKDFIIIDDICDGGRTFIEISKVINQIYPDARCYLIVTHGIFSAGFGELTEWFDGIYCTNSIKDVAEYTTDNSGTGKSIKTKVKQLNVF